MERGFHLIGFCWKDPPSASESLVVGPVQKTKIPAGSTQQLKSKARNSGHKDGKLQEVWCLVSKFLPASEQTPGDFPFGRAQIGLRHGVWVAFKGKDRITPPKLSGSLSLTNPFDTFPLSQVVTARP